MPGDLTDTTRKLRWAHHQFRLLYGALAEYVYANPYVAVVEDDSEAEEYVVRAVLRTPPPPSIGLTASDFFNNTQGALDFLAAQLVIRERGPGSVGNHTTFPIKKRQRDGTEPDINILYGSRGGQKAIKDAEVLAALRDVQPYKDGADEDGHPLAVLRHINGHSKHRHLPVVVTTTGQFFLQWPTRPGIMRGLTNLTRTFEDGEEIHRIPYADSPEGRPDCKATFSPEVRLTADDIPDRPPLGDEAARIFNYVHNQVMGRFAKFFPEVEA